MVSYNKKIKQESSRFNFFSYVVSGSYSINYHIDDTVLLTFAALNLQGGQYKKIFDKNIYTICSTLYNETFREIYEDFQTHQKYQVPWKTCPYPTGPNEIFNYYLEDFGSMLPPYVPGGEKWKMDIRYFKGDELLGGFSAYLTLRSERSLLGN